MPETRIIRQTYLAGTGPNRIKITTQRTITARPLTFSCQRCGQEETREQLPGPAPRYCEACRPLAQAERNAAKQRRHRKRLQEGVTLNQEGVTKTQEGVMGRQAGVTGGGAGIARGKREQEATGTAERKAHATKQNSRSGKRGRR